MFKKILNKHYGIDAHETNPIGKYLSCNKDNHRYLLVPIEQMKDEELEELELVSTHLIQSGDQNVCTFLYTNENSKWVEWESKRYCVLAYQQKERRFQKVVGRKLAKFHYRGRSVSFQVQYMNRIGQWKHLWEKRIDQMEKYWNSMLFQQPENEFDALFMESFPYYMMVAENAIQYLIDTELDEEPQTTDNGTVCHKRFSLNCWDSESVKNPFDWVFDHCSRDLADWTREKYYSNNRTYQPEVQRFFAEYQTITKLSPFAWRLLYARILFPLHYIECIEEYYSTTSEQKKHLLFERLDHYLKQSEEHEVFLKSFYQIVEVPVLTYQIPRIEWL